MTLWLQDWGVFFVWCRLFLLYGVFRLQSERNVNDLTLYSVGAVGNNHIESLRNPLLGGPMSGFKKQDRIQHRTGVSYM
jgi:hypothetical protein